MYTTLDQSLTTTSKHDQGHRKDKRHRERTFVLIAAVFTVALLLVSFTSVDIAQIHAVNYTFASTSSNALKAYIRFTGTQFLIINKNPFDWTDIRINVIADSSQDRTLHKMNATRPFVLTIPRIHSGGAYAVAVTEFRRDDGATLAPVTTRPATIKMWSDTPRGRGYWYGSFLQPPAVAD